MWLLVVAPAVTIRADERVEPVSFEHAVIIRAWKPYGHKLTFGHGKTLALVNDGCTLSMREWSKSVGDQSQVLVSYDSFVGDDDPMHEGKGYHGSTIGIPSSVNYGGNARHFRTRSLRLKRQIVVSSHSFVIRGDGLLCDPGAGKSPLGSFAMSNTSGGDGIVADSRTERQRNRVNPQGSAQVMDVRQHQLSRRLFLDHNTHSKSAADGKVGSGIG